jgi:hypothetical protein
MVRRVKREAISSTPITIRRKPPAEARMKMAGLKSAAWWLPTNWGRNSIDCSGCAPGARWLAKFKR